MLKERPMLADIIDREYLQQLQDNISSAANLSTIILDHLGAPITKITNPRGLCKLTGDALREGPVCQKTRKKLCGTARETRKFATMICPISATIGGAVPIFLDDTFLGAWIIGQFRFQGDPVEAFTEAAQKSGIDSGAAQKLLEDIPEFSRSEFEIIVDFMSIVTEEIVKLSSSNMEIMEKNELLTNLSERLERYITQRKKMEEELNQMAFFDRVLQIPNRERMELDIKNDRSYEYLVVVALEDLRRINNIFGRDCGDALLRAVRDYILGMNISDSTLYRGEISDFNLLFKGTEGNIDLPQKTAKKIYERCKGPWEIPAGEQQHNIFTSVNVCVLPLDGSAENFIDSLYSIGEDSLAIARKTEGVVIYDDDAHERFQAGLKLELSLKNAVCENMRGFQVLYQPIVDAGIAMWRGVEALCRWDSPEFGPVPPGMFIPVAEANGLIGSIGLWVLERAIMQVKAWGLDRVSQFLLEVNLSPIQLAIPDLDQIIIGLLKKYNYPPKKLGLEVTESSKLNFSESTMAAIERLSESGVAIILDDFGTGYSSFHTLHKLPVKLLKTDRTFISDMESDDGLRRLLSVMILLAHGSDIKLVAEGVESSWQAQFLFKQGADFFQGYYFSHPLTAGQLAEKLENFYKPMGELVIMEYSKWDLAKISESQSEYERYALGPELYNLLNRCVREIFTNPNDENAINVALSYVGNDLHINRVHVVVMEDDGTYSARHEWCSQGTMPIKNLLQRLPAEKIFNDWLNIIKRDGMITVSDIRTLPKNACMQANRQGVKAFIHFPVWNGDELYGYIELQHCRDTHSWTREEVQMLHNLTGLVTITLGKKRFQNEIALRGEIKESIFNNINTAIYVSDLGTNRILFANKELQRMFGGKPITGRVCWEELHDRKERCGFCPIPYLLKNPGKVYQWEYYHENLQRRFRVQDSIIPWLGGKMAHLEFAVDITDL